MITKLLRQHVDKHSIFPAEQRALRKEKRGCLDALLIDSMVNEEVCHWRKKLSAAWVDYSTAFDRVPHGWLLEVLNSIRAPTYLRHCVANLLPLWATQFKLGFGRNTVKVDLHYRHGLFQGDSLSPLLFCLSIVPLSHALRSIDGYKSKSFGGRVTHLLLMDDLKVYARDERSMKKSLSLVDRVSKVVGMELGLRKCAVANILRGKLQEGGALALSDDRTVPAASKDDRYSYLGIEQVIEPDLKTVKCRGCGGFGLRISTPKYKAQATNVWAVSIFRYFFGILKWTKADLIGLDRTTRCIMRKNKCHQYSAASEIVPSTKSWRQRPPPFGSLKRA